MGGGVGGAAAAVKPGAAVHPAAAGSSVKQLAGTPSPTSPAASDTSPSWLIIDQVKPILINLSTYLWIHTVLA